MSDADDEKRAPTTTPSTSIANTERSTTRRRRSKHRRKEGVPMGFLMTTIIFVVVGVVASVLVRLCCNRGPSTNLYVVNFCSSSFILVSFDIDNHGNSLLLDDVGNHLSCTAETSDCPNSQRRRVRCVAKNNLDHVL
ncbi:ATPase, H transporting, lysosomal 9kDa, V0 subunit e1 [Musa troglodytarum]|uniref:ATPase, H transporting, lysosomal 9kDa, V0 subunit e1 n=1 Tax=Musa troglodytarum TaxID=320322 RepID=A0A9E7FLM7_9LILI|nr:ATPase, H transporting, lysosomal 9kDa, V0 subunit e1 [Musa troglodytarum]